jgi:hypothetical protein
VSIVLSGNASISRTANLPAATAFALAGWFYFDTVDYDGAIAHLGNTGGYLAQLRMNAGGGLRVATTNAGANGPSVPARTWVHLFLRRAGNDVTAGILLPGETAYNGFGTTTGDTGTPNLLSVGANPWFSSCPGMRVFRLDTWDGDPAAAGFVAAAYADKGSPTSLNTHLALTSPILSMALRDTSGNNRDWSESGASIADNPPWAQQFPIKPPTTGEPTGVSIDPLGYKGPTSVGGTGTVTYNVTDMPIGEGCIIAITFNGWTTGTITGCRLSVDGEPLHFWMDGPGMHGFALFPNITEKQQAIKVDYANASGAGAQLNATTFRVSGHRKDRMLGTTVYSTDTPIQVTMQKENSALFIMATQTANPFRLNGTGSWFDLPAQWTPAYSSATAYWMTQGKSGSYESASGGMYDWAWIEILAGEKQRRSRFITVREPWTTQPQGPVEIDWSNPLTEGLVFCAVPVGSTFIDLVTNEVGVPEQTINARVLSRNSGYSNVNSAQVLEAGGVAGTQILWPVSLERGGDIVNEGTILALGGATHSDDGYLIPIGGNTEVVTNGEGFALAIDSYNYNNRGKLLRCKYSGAVLSDLVSATTGGDIGTEFQNQLHFFGYGFTENGSKGLWFTRGNYETWTGGTVLQGTTTTNRRARIYTCGSNSGGTSLAGVVALMMMWKRQLSPVEYKSLYDNCWQIFKPRERRIFTGSPVLTHKRRRLL